jgi:predicted Ser/Thr protein kinase
MTQKTVVAADSITSTETLPKISDRRLQYFFRATWIVFAAVALLVNVVSIPAYIQTCNCAPEIVAEWETLGIAQGVRIVFVALTAFNMGVLLLLSALIFWRRPDEVMAIFVSLSSLVQGVFLVAGPAGSPAPWYYAVRVITNFLTPISWIALLFLFPNGRFVPRWSRWLLVALTISLLAVGLAGSTPLGKPLTFLTAGMGLVSIGVGLWGLRQRYQIMKSATQHQQIKWTFFALVLVAITLVIFLPIQALIKDIEPLAIYTIFRHIIFALAQAFVPVSICVAMLRYRLWDIDFAINRALVSGIVTVGLGLLFVLEFLVTQQLLTMLLGKDQIYVAVAVPAAITALLFNPTRKRVRSLVDRHLYGFRFDLDQLNAAQNEPPITNPGILSGQTLGSYKVLDVIAKGGMGEVYKGFGNDHPVAIKVLPRESAAEADAQARFKREAETLTTLTHPNIVKFYDHGETEHIQYLVMELIDGVELGDYLKQQGQLALDEVRAILAQLADALDYAHNLGYIHRDIKPSNIMLARIDGKPKPVLMDFGIAKIKDDSTSITGSGAIGTIDYMSPEQIKEAREVDRRTDVYALGVMLYQMLTGELPFKGHAGQVLFAHLQQPAPDPRLVRPDLPRDLAHAVLKALAKEPDERFASAGELARAFQGEREVAA